MSVDAVVYAARSKDEDAGKDSTGDQVAAIEKRLAELGDRLVVGKPHVDHASGYTKDRGPGLEAAVEAAIASAPSELWVFHSSRLARGSGRQDEARSLMEVLAHLRRHGVAVRSVEDDAFLTNPMLWGVADEMAHKYSADLSAHTRKGKQTARERGDWPGGPVPDGYRYGQDGALVVDETRAPIIRRMFELALEGLPYNAIARKLNAEGHGTVKGLPWNGYRVKDALSNPVYAGRLVFRRRSAEPSDPLPGNWEALVDDRTFDLVGAKAVIRREGKPQSGRPTVQYALSHLAVCDRCDRPMYGRMDPYTRKDGTRRRSYVCASVKNKTGTCNAPRVDADRVDAAVAAQLETLFIDIEAWKHEIARSAETQRSTLEAGLARARKALSRVQSQRDTARERYIEKQTLAREDALEHVLGLAKDAEARVADLQASLGALPKEVPMDAMLDATNALRQELDRPGPVNERLRRIFAEFRIGVVDETIVVLPVLLPDLIEQHSDPDGMIRIVSGEKVGHIGPPADGDATASPVMLVVPPSKTLQVPIDNNACE